eukprot:361380-Chlamydomonas_euryale.AAC.5
MCDWKECGLMWLCSGSGSSRISGEASRARVVRAFLARRLEQEGVRSVAEVPGTKEGLASVADTWGVIQLRPTQQIHRLRPALPGPATGAGGSGDLFILDGRGTPAGGPRPASRDRRATVAGSATRPRPHPRPGSCAPPHLFDTSLPCRVSLVGKSQAAKPHGLPHGMRLMVTTLHGSIDAPRVRCQICNGCMSPPAWWGLAGGRPLPALRFLCAALAAYL